jgi:hypothetical protein
MAIRYSDKPYGYSPQRTEDWRARFPSHSRSMDSAPTMGSRPVLLFEPSGKATWGIHHNGAWRGGQNFRDPFTGRTQWRMDGSLISNPVRWASSF